MDRESVYRLVQAGRHGYDRFGGRRPGMRWDRDRAIGVGAAREPAQQASRIKDSGGGTQHPVRPSYPKLAQLNNQLKEIDAQILAETKKIAGKIRGHNMAALQREGMLRDALEKQKQEQNKLNESAIEYSLLKRDLDTNRQLYEGPAGKIKRSRSFGGPALQ
jgi:hypothetical protein